MDFRPLRRHRDYRALYAAQAVSFLGSMVTYVALPYQMYQLTRSPEAVGLLGLAELLPLLITAFVGGALADTRDRRRIVLATEAGLMLGSAALAATALLGRTPVGLLYGIAAYMSALNGLQRPSLDALTPRLVDPEEIPATAALAAFRGSLGMILGPALGGALLASTGLAATYGFDLLTYVVSFLAIRAIRTPLPPSSDGNPDFASVREGFRYAKSRQELVGTYVVDIVAMIFGMPIALFPALAAGLGGPKALGLLYAAPAGGALLASLSGRLVPRVHRHGRAILFAATAWGLAIVAFGFCDRLVPAVACLMAAGGADATSGIFRMTVWNQTIPDALRGRLAGIEMLSYMSGPLLGNVEAGLVAGAFGVRASVVSGGVLCCVGVVLCAVLLPRFVGYDARAWQAALPTPQSGA